MKAPVENYEKHVLIGLAFTFVIVLGMAYYQMGETSRLANAADALHEERVELGHEIYQEQCSACHGANGEGGVGPALNNKKVLKDTFDSIFFSVIRSGVPGTVMPAWSLDYGGPLTDQDINAVVAFIREWEDAESVPETPDSDGGLEGASGEELYQAQCAACHGAEGEGGIGAAMKPNQFVSDNSDEDLVKFVLSGREGTAMVGFDGRLNEAEIADIVAFLRSWQE